MVTPDSEYHVRIRVRNSLGVGPYGPRHTFISDDVPPVQFTIKLLVSAVMV